VAETSINRLQTPLRQQFLKALSKNFRPVARPGMPGAPGTGGTVGTPLSQLHGQLAFRDAAARAGLIIIEANIKDPATHTIEISQTAGTSFGAAGGTPAAATVTGGRAWDPIVYASAGLKQLAASNSSPPALGAHEVQVP